MNKFTIDVWYKVTRYSSLEIIADTEEEAKEYARYLEFCGGLDYDNEGDSDDSGIDIMEIDEVTEKEKSDFNAIDKNNTIIHVGDIVKYVGAQIDGAPVYLEGEIKSIVLDVGWGSNTGGTQIDSIQIGIKNNEELFIRANEVEKISTVTLRLSDRDYWLQYGDCPKCRIGDSVHPQAGEFVCNKCGWKH